MILQLNCCKILLHCYMNIEQWSWMLRDKVIIQLCVLSHFIDKDIPERWLLTCSIPLQVWFCFCIRCHVNAVFLCCMVKIGVLCTYKLWYESTYQISWKGNKYSLFKWRENEGERKFWIFFLEVNFSLFSLTKQKKMYDYVFFLSSNFFLNQTYS